MKFQPWPDIPVSDQASALATANQKQNHRNLRTDPSALWLTQDQRAICTWLEQRGAVLTPEVIQVIRALTPKGDPANGPSIALDLARVIVPLMLPFKHLVETAWRSWDNAQRTSVLNIYHTIADLDVPCSGQFSEDHDATR